MQANCNPAPDELGHRLASDSHFVYRELDAFNQWERKCVHFPKLKAKATKIDTFQNLPCFGF